MFSNVRESTEQTSMPQLTTRRQVSNQPTVSYLSVFPNGDGQNGSNEKLHMPNLDGNGVVGPCKTVDEEKLHSGKYLELRKYNFIDAKGQAKSAEGVHMIKNESINEAANERKKSLGNVQHDLCTIAVIRKQILCDSLVLVKQYRAPLKAYTIEFPARVINDEEVPQDLAREEIQDDTGYSSSVVKYISPLTSLEPDISDGKLQFVSLNIDGDDPLQTSSYRNNNQTAEANHGAHGDIVEVIRVPINGLLERLERLDQQGCVIDSRVVAFAIGLQKGAALLETEAVIEQEEAPM